MKTLSLSEVKARLSELVSEVESRDERVVITRKGRPAAVLVSQDDLESWQETLEIASDPEFMADIRRGIREIERGQTVGYEKVFRRRAARAEAISGPRKVELSLAAAGVIRGAHPQQRRKIRAMVDALRDRSDIGKPLRRELGGFWSARVGRYRVIYRRSRSRLDVVLVGPRATICEETSRLLRRDRGS